MFGRRFLAIVLAGGCVLLPGCQKPELPYPDPSLAGQWYLTESGPFTVPEDRTLSFSQETLAYVYPEPTQDLLDDLVMGLTEAPFTYPVTLTGPYTVNLDALPTTIDYAIETVAVDLGGMKVSLENYLRTMSIADRSRFYTSMEQKLGVTLERQDVASLLSAIELYQAAKLHNDYAAGFLGLYDVFQCDMVLQMELGARPATLNHPLTFRGKDCNNAKADAPLNE